MFSSMISEMVLVICQVLVIEYFNLANPKNAFAIRVGYGVVWVLLLAALAYIRSCITKSKENGFVTVVVWAKPLSDEEPNRETISIQDYDKRELNKLLQKAAIDVAFRIGLHMWLKSLYPLLYYPILHVKDLFTSNLFQIHVLKRPAVGKLARPWKETDLFAYFQKNKNTQQQKKPTSVVELKESEEVATAEVVELQKSEGEEDVCVAEEPEKKSAEKPLLKNRKITVRRDD